MNDLKLVEKDDQQLQRLLNSPLVTSGCHLAVINVQKLFLLNKNVIERSEGNFDKQGVIEELETLEGYKYLGVLEGDGSNIQ